MWPRGNAQGSNPIKFLKIFFFHSLSQFFFSIFFSFFFFFFFFWGGGVGGEGDLLFCLGVRRLSVCLCFVYGHSKQTRSLLLLDLYHNYTMFPAATFQTTVDETVWPWDNVRERYRPTYLVVTAVEAGTNFKSDEKFATVVPRRWPTL